MIPRPVRCSACWIWAARWRRVLIRAVVVYHVVGIAVALFAAPAHAQDGQGGVPDNEVFSWMDIKDSHGISVWRYFMSLDHGNARNPGKLIYAFVIECEYEIYRGMTAATIWVLDYTLKFDWLTTLLAPVRSIGGSLTAMTGQMNLAGTLLTAAALVAGCWMLRGRWATGVYEIVMSCLIAVVAVGALSNPVDRVAGPDGVVMQARDAGLQLAAGITHNGDTAANSDDMVDQLSQSLADTLIRQPTQMLNFGRVIDAMPGPEGQQCVQAWNHGFDKHPGNTRDTLKDNVRRCEGGGNGVFDGNGGPMKAYADNPGPNQIAAGLALIIGGLVLMLFGWALAFAVFAATCTALFQALKAIPGLLAGIAPGVARGGLWKIAANLVMALVTIVFACVFVAAYMIVIRDFFATPDGNLFRKIFLTDLVLVAGLVMFRRGVRSIRSLSDVLASKLATRPGAAPTHIHRTTPHAGMLQSAYYGVQLTGQAARTGSRAVRAARSFTATQKAAAFVGAHGAAATIGTAASGGAAAAVWRAWKVAQKAAGGTHILRSAAEKNAPTTMASDSGRRPTGDPSPHEQQMAAVRQELAAARHSHRPRPDEVHKPGVKRRVGTAMPVTQLRRATTQPRATAPRGAAATARPTPPAARPPARP
ncbi:hypothetical protein [Nocardia transvalensis]|uniref:hypothetical protein n=1 Tax=Nocardia transvalensis TaxID=37333 RepID=UPI001894E9F0|nr:hypothetical protein [Nocardia transvalensis]MBF6333531.1 hypothetical protein [Nocardia transvalensis]